MILNISTFSFGLINTDIFLYELSKIKDTLFFLSNYNGILCRAKLVYDNYAKNMDKRENIVTIIWALNLSVNV